MSFTLIIPARSGSKRIQGKNSKEFHGIPMIVRTIRKAIESGVFSEIYVSTDSSDISKLALTAGAKVPFLREATLSDDFTPTLPVIQDFISRAEIDTEFVCCLYPATPMLEVTTLQNACQEHKIPRNKFLVSVVRSRVSPLRMFNLNSANEIDNFDSEYLGKRTQDLTQSYTDAGQFYIAHKSTWMNSMSILEGAIGYEVSQYEGIDIDTEEDWDLAEKLFTLS